LSQYTKIPGIFPGGKFGLWGGVTTLPHSFADCLELWRPQPPGILTAWTGLYRDCFTLFKRPTADKILFTCSTWM